MLTTLQSRIQYLLERSEWFDGVTIITEESGSLLEQIQKATAKLGFYVLVATPAGRLEAAQGERLKLRHLVSVNLIEKHLTNKTGLRAKDGVIHAINALHNQWNGLGKEPNRSQTNRIEVQSFNLVPDDGLTIYQINAETSATIQS